MIVHSVRNSLMNSCTAPTKSGLIRMFKERLCIDCVKEAEQEFRKDESKDMLECLLETDCGMKWSYYTWQGASDEW